MERKKVKTSTKKFFNIVVEHYGCSKFHPCTPYLYFEKSNEGDLAKGEYCFLHNELILYYNNIESIEELVKTIIHEYQHYLQSPSWFTRYYKMGYSYSDHPYEVKAYKEEQIWKKLWEN